MPTGDKLARSAGEFFQIIRYDWDSLDVHQSD